MEREEAERERKKEEDERRKRKEEAKRKSRILEAAFDGDNDEILAVLEEVFRIILIFQCYLAAVNISCFWPACMLELFL